MKHLWLVFVFWLLAAPVTAHEFFIEPLSYQVEPGQEIQAQYRVGQNFSGGKIGYLDFRTVRNEYVLGGETTQIPARNGDRPAVKMTLPGEGLLTLVHETTNESLTYKTWEKFVNFVTHKDALWTLDVHKARGLPLENFVETYSRHAKSLIAVGAGAGQDQFIGLPAEIVALQNPYTTPNLGQIDLHLFVDGQPKPKGQIELFEKTPDGTVNITIHHTDAAGIVSVPVKPGHSYLADHVVLTARSGDGVWHSTWASLTFLVPE